MASGKGHSDSERKPAAATWVTLSDHQQGFFYMHHHRHAFDTPVMEHCLERVEQWVHHEGSIQRSLMVDPLAIGCQTNGIYLRSNEMKDLSPRYMNGSDVYDQCGHDTRTSSYLHCL